MTAKRPPATTSKSKRSTAKRSRKPKADPKPTTEDSLSTRDELFIELYFHYDFDPVRAYLRSGYSSNLSTARGQAYRLLNHPAIQAAILRRREAARKKRTLSREEKVEILEGMVRDERAETRDRLLAMRMHTMLVGDMPESDPARALDRLTASALKALPMAELIDQVNRGIATRVLPSPIIDVTPIPKKGRSK